MAMVRDNFVPGVLNPGDIMNGSKSDKLFSPNSDYFLVMQEDNNLVLYKVGYDPQDNPGDRNQAVWATGTNSGTPGTATAQITQAGALEVKYDDGGIIRYWSSAQSVPPIPGSILRVQNDGGLRIYTHKDCWQASK